MKSLAGLSQVICHYFDFLCKFCFKKSRGKSEMTFLEKYNKQMILLFFFCYFFISVTSTDLKSHATQRLNINTYKI